jgi:alpha-tubulin suppressor-like RCC1 family protein
VSVGGSSTCALTAPGGLKCWGSNTSGQVGNGTTIDQPVPVDVTGLTEGVLAVSAGLQHTCSLNSFGDVKCWGANSSGQLGDGSQTSSTTPVDVIGLSSDIVAISAGGFHTCATTSSGGVKCWGSNQFGALGDGTTEMRPYPADVLGLSASAISVSAGNGHTCASTDRGRVLCWGTNREGELGDGTDTNRLTPVQVIGFAGTREPWDGLSPRRRRIF